MESEAHNTKTRMLRTTLLLATFLIAIGPSGCAKDESDVDVAVKPTSDSKPSEIEADSDEVRVLGTLPDFTLTEQSGVAIGLADFRNRVWIGNFIFTRCLATCPRQTTMLRLLQDELKTHPKWKDIRLVSITVDPEFDTPEVLAGYSRNHGADSEHWKFLTGPRDAIWNLSKEGFKLPVGEDPNATDMPIFHSQQFILVDRTGRIRGYYNSGDDRELKKLKDHLEIVLNEPLSAAEEGATALRKFPYPEDVMAPEWLVARRNEQLETTEKFDVFHEFQFADLAEESGITFENKSVDYACKINIAAHYDHGNGVAVADVDGDGLLDVYFTTQIGANQLWKNVGGGKFTDISTPEIALADQIGASASFADTDNDGDPDLYVSSIRGGNYFFVNDGKGQFTDRTTSSGLEYSGHSSSGVFFDYDRDGLVDLFLCNVGVFTKDEVDPQGIHPPLGDAFAGHLKPEQRNERSILYKNLGDNQFAEVTRQTGLVDDSWAGDASPIDVNEDGWPDLYVLNMQGHDEYYQNVDGKRFEKKSREVFPSTSWGAMGIQVFDFDNDGKMDIYITDMHSDMSAPIELEEENQKSNMVWPESFLRSGGNSIFGNSFFHNQGGGRFIEISDKIGAENYWPWGLSVGDLNADGFEDVFVAASMNYPFRYCVNKVLLNNKGQTFLESEFILGVEPRLDGRTAKPNFTLEPNGEDKDHQLVERLKIKEPVEVWGALGTRSSVIFDLDNDGDLDILTGEFNDGPMVLVNNLSDQKPIHWLKVQLSGKTSNADGLGAVVRVHADKNVYTKVNDGQSGYLSQSAYPLYFGLGDADVVDKLIVKWPTGKEQTVAGPIQSNQSIDIAEE